MVSLSIELLEGEVFKKVPIDCVKDYYVSNKGRMSNGKRILKQQTNHRGYKYIYLYKEPKNRNYYVHRLVMYAFIGDMPEKDMVVNHIDEVKDNNNLENLEWVTQSQNALHSITEETIERLREQSKDLAIKNRKRIKLEEISSGKEFVFDSIKDASLFLGTTISSITMVAKGHRKTHKGHKAYYL